MRLVRPLRAWLFVLLACCGAPSLPSEPRFDTEPQAKASPERSPCQEVAALREQAAAKREEGKLRRATRLLEKAAGLCTSEEQASWALGCDLLTELGRYDEALSLAGRIEAWPEASTEARSAAERARESAVRFGAAPADPKEARAEMQRRFHEAREKEAAMDLRGAMGAYLSAWEAFHPNGRALARAGMAAMRAGESVAAHRLWDRALSDFERTSKKPLEVDMPNGLMPPARALSWAHGAAWLAVAHGDFITRVRYADSKIESQLPVGPSVIRALAISPDNSLIAAGAEDGSVQLFNTEVDEEVETLEGDGAAVSALTFAPDGRRLVAGLQDGRVKQWSLPGFKPEKPLAGGGVEVTALAFTKDGAELAIGTADGGIRVWDMASQTLERELPESAGPISALAFAPDGKHLASSAPDDDVRVWNLGFRHSSSRVLRGNRGRALSLSFLEHRGLPLVVAPWDDAETRIWHALWGLRIRPPVLRPRWVASPANARAGALSEDGRVRALAMRDGSVKLRGTLEGMEDPERTLTKRSSAVLAVAFSPDNTRLGSVSLDGIARVWDSGERRLFHRLPRAAVRLTSVAFSPDGLSLAAGTDKRTIQLWEVATGRFSRSLLGHGDMVSSIAFSKRGDALASGSEDGTVKLWEPKTGLCRHTLRALGGPIRTVAFSPDGAMVAAGSRSGSVRLWSSSGALLKTLVSVGSSVNSVDFSSDGRMLAVGAGDGALRVFDVGSGAELLSKGSTGGGITSVAFSSVGVLAAGYEDKAVRLWDVRSGGLVHTLKGHEGAVRSVAFSKGEAVLSSSSSDGTIKLWDPYGGALLATLVSVMDDKDDPRVSPDAAAVFTPDGHIDFLGKDPCAARAGALCRVGAVRVGFELCEEEAYSRGLLARILAGDMGYLDPRVESRTLVCGE